MPLHWEELWTVIKKVKADKTDFRQNMKNIFENYSTQNTKEVQLNIILQWTLELRTQSVLGDGSTFKLFDFRVKFPHKK
jgi:hypothetical protein